MGGYSGVIEISLKAVVLNLGFATLMRVLNKLYAKKHNFWSPIFCTSKAKSVI